MWIGFQITAFKGCSCTDCASGKNWALTGEIKYTWIDISENEISWILDKSLVIRFGETDCERFPGEQGKWVFMTEGICETDENFNIAAHKFIQELVAQEKFIYSQRK